MNAIDDKKRAVIYCRVSTKEQVEEGNSLATQEKLCQDYALKNGFAIVEKFIEQGESAKTADRTQLQRLLAFCADHRNNVQAVIAYRIDRISRNTDDYSQIRMLLKRYRVEIKSTSEKFEDTPTGRFMENMIANVAQFDNDVRTERSIGGMKEAMREGRYVWQASYGYSNTRLYGKATICQNEKAPLVEKAFLEIAKNAHPLEEIRLSLIKEGLCNWKGKPLSKSHFYRMIRNPLYAGWIIKFGEKHKGTFEPIVDQQLFDQVQRVLQLGGRKNQQYKVAHEDFPLRRFITSSDGRKLTGAWSTGKKKRYPYYIFRQPNAFFSTQAVEDAFMRYLNNVALDEKHFQKLKDFIHRHLDLSYADTSQLRKEMEVKLTQLKDKQSALIQKNLEGVISNSILQEQLTLLEEELSNTTARLYSLPKQRLNYDKAMEELKDFLVTPSNVWKHAPLESKIKLQWFYFPKGVVMEKWKSRTPEKSLYFKAESVFFPCLSSKVTLRNQISNTIEIEENNTSQHVNGTIDTTTSDKSVQVDIEAAEKFADQLNTLKEVKETMKKGSDP